MNGKVELEACCKICTLRQKHVLSYPDHMPSHAFEAATENSTCKHVVMAWHHMELGACKRDVSSSITILQDALPIRSMCSIDRSCCFETVVAESRIKSTLASLGESSLMSLAKAPRHFPVLAIVREQLSKIWPKNHRCAIQRTEFADINYTLCLVVSFQNFASSFRDAGSCRSGTAGPAEASFTSSVDCSIKLL